MNNRARIKVDSFILVSSFENPFLHCLARLKIGVVFNRIEEAHLAFGICGSATFAFDTVRASYADLAAFEFGGFVWHINY